MGKWDFDGDEALFFFIAAAMAVVGFFRWYLTLARRSRMARATTIRRLLAVVPVILLAGLWIVLNSLADAKTVVGQIDYQLLFLAGGMAWLWHCSWLLPIFGINTWDDAIDRANPAAAAVVCGAMCGAMLIYAASNIGNGPTIWTTLGPAFMATAGWYMIWMIIELIARPSEAVAIDRDLAGGIRFAGYLTSSALILGRACSGDWASWQTTLSELAHSAWPVLLLATVAIITTVIFRPTVDGPVRPLVAAGIIPGVVFILLAIAFCALPVSREGQLRRDNQSTTQSR